MTKKFKIILGISYLFILFLFLYFVFSEIEFGRFDEFSYYKELQAKLDYVVGNNLILNLIIFFYFWNNLGFTSWFWISTFNFIRNFIWKVAWNCNFYNFNYLWRFNTLFANKSFFQRISGENIDK